MTSLSNLSRAQKNSRARAKIELLRQRSIKYGFRYFVINVFSKSFPEFVRGQYIEDVIKHFEDNKYTMDVTGRDHFKSTRLYADVMYHIFTEQTAWEAHYMSFSKDMAEYHLMKINAYIEANPAFKLMFNHKITSEYMLVYSWSKNSPKMMVKPKGMFEFKRGIHSEAIYVDDAFKDVDETKELDPVIIRKVNEVMKSELLPMVKKGGVCRVVGTPQTDEDFFFDAPLQKKFKAWITPAIQDREKQIALWPEWMSFKDLIEKEEQLGERRFSREYMARPLKSSNSYIPKDQYESLEKTTSWKYADHSQALTGKIVVAGFDIGKKRHPSHLAAFIKSYVKVGTGDNAEMLPKYIQIYSEWFDHVNYSKQIEKLNQFCDWFNISKLRYDNTRAEFESFYEEGKLHPVMEPIVFTAKRKNSMATVIESLFDTKRITIIKEERQAKQFLSVNANLEAVETSLGHGDSFWSIGLAVGDEEDIIQVRSI